MLIGNPNTGKSTIFNKLTKLNQKVSNFSGVTTEKTIGSFLYKNFLYDIIDLPGIYSLYSDKSINENIIFNIIYNKNDIDYPDIVIFVADSTNLKRNLFLYTQISDLGIPTLLVLNMIDTAYQNGIKIDLDYLKNNLNNNIVTTNAESNNDILKLKESIFQFKISNYRYKLTKNIDQIEPYFINEIKKKINLSNFYQCLYFINHCFNLQKVSTNYKNIIYNTKEKYNIIPKRLKVQETIIRYKFISQILKYSLVYKNKFSKNIHLYNKIDIIITHKIYGIILFIFILLIMFQSVFILSNYPNKLIEQIFCNIIFFIKNNFKENLLSDLLINGILPGLQSVLTFVPQIAILFGFITIFEDTGYMSRIIFIMDNIMRKIGLNGYSIIPLISSMACAVPAIISTRNITNTKERILTILATPLMSCSARIPIYILLISIIIPKHYYLYGFNGRGLLLFLMYCLGVIFMIIYSYIIHIFWKSRELSSLVMELPKYKMPSFISIFISVYNRSKIFIKEIIKILITTSIILWVLSNYGYNDQFNIIKVNKIENSYIACIGKFMEPIVKPLGFDWRIGISIIMSIAAREVFVSSITTIYNIEFKNNMSLLSDSIKSITDIKTGLPIFNIANASSLLIFYVFSMQCISTLFIIYQETKIIFLPIIYFIVMTLHAYVLSLIVYQVLYLYI